MVRGFDSGPPHTRHVAREYAVTKIVNNEWRGRRAWCADAYSLQMRIGLSSGLAKVGFMETPDFAAYTMTDSSVNLGHWLEERCKIYGVAILVSEATRGLIASEMILRTIDTVHPKGDGRETISEILGPRGATPSEAVRAAEAYEGALQLHAHGKWAAAANVLRRTPELRGDAAAARLLRRCEMRSGRRRRRRMFRGRPSIVNRFARWLGA